MKKVMLTVALMAGISVASSAMAAPPAAATPSLWTMFASFSTSIVDDLNGLIR